MADMTSIEYSAGVTVLVYAFAHDARPECERRWKAWRQDWEGELRRRHFGDDPDAANRLHQRDTDLDDPLYLLNSITRTWRNVFSDLGGDTERQMVFDLKQMRNDAAHRPQRGSKEILERAHSLASTLRQRFRLPPPPALGAPGVHNPGPGPVAPTSVGGKVRPSDSISPVAVPTFRPGTTQPPTTARGERRDDRQEIYSFYFLCDTSFSMDGPGIDTVNTQLGALHRSIVSNPLAADKCRLGILRFSTRAEVLLPLCDASEVSSLPVLTADGVTNYAKAFDLLRATIHSDQEALKSTHRLLRPVVYMITDGSPTDTAAWQDAARQCLDSSSIYAPKLVLYMLGDVADTVRHALEGDRNILQPTFLDVRNTADLSAAIATAVNSITASITATAASDTREFRLTAGG